MFVIIIIIIITIIDFSIELRYTFTLELIGWETQSFSSDKSNTRDCYNLTNIGSHLICS